MLDFTSTTKARFGIILLDGFSMLTFGAILEPLTLLSKKNGESGNGAVLFSQIGLHAQSNGNHSVLCDADIDALENYVFGVTGLKVLFVCGPSDQIVPFENGLTATLRRAQRMGVCIVGLGSTAWSLAEVGILSNVPATVHWSTMLAFSETNSSVQVENKLFTSTTNVATCGGEAAALDLVLDMITNDFPDLAGEIANQLLVSFRRDGATPQPSPKWVAMRHFPATLCKAATIMSDYIEEPISGHDLALRCGVSLRQLERLFQTYLRITPMKYYMQIRLQKAHQLVTLTSLSLIEIAVASGFATTSHMSRKFRELYGCPPSELRLKLDFGC